VESRKLLHEQGRVESRIVAHSSLAMRIQEAMSLLDMANEESDEGIILEVSEP